MARAHTGHTTCSTHVCPRHLCPATTASATTTAYIPPTYRLHLQPIHLTHAHALVDVNATRERSPCAHAGGDWADEMFLIYRGVVRIVELSEELGHGIYLKDGDYFGEIAVLTGGRRMMSVRAVTYCHLYSLQQKLLERILQQHPDCINNLLVNMMGACEQPCSPDPVARRANGRAPSRPPCLPGRLATARLGFEAGVPSRTASVICSACSRMFCSRTVSFPLAPLLAFFAHPLPAHVRLGRSVAFASAHR